jgi:para-nitrobenzyl esterase
VVIGGIRGVVRQRAFALRKRGRPSPRVRTLPITRRNILAGSMAALPYYLVSNSILASPKNGAAPVVETRDGPIRGVVDGTVAIFRGIPFAAAPVGGLRFRAPEPPTKWKGVRDATQFGPICPQNPSRLSRVMGDFDLPQAEDNCLTLNVWTPTLGGARAPVIVWIHGGGYTSGSGRLDWYSGLQFARNGGIVVVTINYRLGPLGFLYMPGVCQGNLGILDQRMALRWVKDNISRFGGDSDNITIAGQSGGGRSAVIHMADNETNNLFHRAIMQSAAIGAPPVEPEQAIERSREYLAVLKLDNPADITALPADRLLAGFAELSRRVKRFAYTTPPFETVRDGVVFRRDPVDVIIEKAGPEIDILLGTTRDESTAHLAFDDTILNATPAQVQQRFEIAFGAQADVYLDEYRRMFPDSTPYALLVHLITETSYLRKSLAIAEARAKQGHPAYVFRFDLQSPVKRLGACHTLELPFVFSNFESWNNAPMLAGADREEMEALSKVIHRAWINFIKSGNPNHDRLPSWAPYDTDLRTTMRFDTMVEPVGDLAGLRWRRPWPSHAS